MLTVGAIMTEQSDYPIADKLVTEGRVLCVCRGTGCESSHSAQIHERLADEVLRQSLSNVQVKRTGCPGFCEYGPIVSVEPEGVFYTHVTPEDAEEIVGTHLVEGRLLERLLYRDPATGEAVPHYRDFAFYAKQKRNILRRCGHIDPENIDDYLATEGYAALHKVLFEMSPDQVIDEVYKSGLRGRGGAGFPTGLKWRFTRGAEGEPKYVVCNADEGDPGAFMNCAELEADPHSLLEGMAIAAYAIGAHQGYIYVRAEYPLAIHRLRIALAQAEERGYLGKNIMGSGFGFSIEIKEGAGAFVCGEETALMASIEGRRGTPRPRPPYPAQSGLWGKPTLLNNVGTFFNVPLIILRGADWYRSIGTERCTGTKAFSLVGQVVNSGLVEVPMGTTLREIIFGIGGGIPKGRTFKAVQTGGPSGGCLPASQLDLPVDYESLAAAGSIVGSGGMVVMDDTTCMVDVARFFLSFTQKESCGKCVPCRLGTKRMLEILERICGGEGAEQDIDLLLDVADTVKSASLCALGQTSVNPVLSTLRYFREEYEAHVKERRCPALACQAMIAYYIQPDKCQGCGRCHRACPTEAIMGDLRMIHIIDQERCIKCGTCLEVCPKRFGAVVKVSGEKIRVPDHLVPVGSVDW